MMSPSNNIDRFGTDQGGHIGISFALLLIPMLAIIGASVDLNKAYTYKKQLQELADAAAVAGARLPATSNENRLNAVISNFEQNAATKNLVGLNPVFKANNAEVRVSVSATSPTSILKLLGIDSIPVEASVGARSQVQNGGVICLLALDRDAPEGLHLQGINKMSQQDCWAWINSTSSEAITAVGASTGRAQGFCVSGGVVGTEHFAPPPFRGCDPYADPFAEKFATYAPFIGDCTENNLQLRSGYHVISPGTYCGGISLKPQAKVVMEPGIYVIKNGDLDIQAQSKLTGMGVTIYFTGTNTGMQVKGGGEVELRAPATGETASFLIVQDRTSNPGEEISIQGGGRVKMEGVLYAPTWKVSIGGNGEVNQEAEFWTMVAATFHMEGNGRLFINSDAAAIGLPNVMPKIPTGPLIMN